MLIHLIFFVLFLFFFLFSHFQTYFIFYVFSFTLVVDVYVSLVLVVVSLRPLRSSLRLTT